MDVSGDFSRAVRHESLVEGVARPVLELRVHSGKITQADLRNIPLEFSATIFSKDEVGLRFHSTRYQRGFSLMELLIVVAISLIIMAMAVPLISNAVKTDRLRQAAMDYANLLQAARMRAVQDDQFYPVITTVGASSACVDLNQSGACNGSSTSAGAEPKVAFHPTVQIELNTSPPALPNLRGQYLPTTCGSTAQCVSINPNSTVGPIFGARGLPCYESGGLPGGSCSYVGPTSVPVAFETFLQNTQTGAWEAVTVSPAGRIREWYYDSNSTSWQSLN